MPDPAPAAFAARLVQRAREFGAPAADLVSNMSGPPRGEGRTLEDAVRASHQTQAALQVSIANAVSALRLCGTLDWGPFVERVSLVEEALRHDPGGTYGRMDFRDPRPVPPRGRGARAGLGRGAAPRRAPCRRPRAGGAPGAPTRARRTSATFSSAPAVRRSKRTSAGGAASRARAKRAFFRHATAAYLGAIAVLTAAGLAAVSAFVRSTGAEPGAEMWAFALAALPVSEIAVFLVQRVVDALIPPRRLPAPRFRGERRAPGSARTLVVFPTLFPTVASVEAMLRHLEVQALANPDANVSFALLSDFTDAVEATRPDDDAILAAASDGVAALERRRTAGRFYLFHRVRRWNPAEGLWMGWETEAREARGAEPPPARRDGHELRPAGRATSRSCRPSVTS